MTGNGEGLDLPIEKDRDMPYDNDHDRIINVESVLRGVEKWNDKVDDRINDLNKQQALTLTLLEFEKRHSKLEQSLALLETAFGDMKSWQSKMIGVGAILTALAAVLGGILEKTFFR